MPGMRQTDPSGDMGLCSLRGQSPFLDEEEFRACERDQGFPIALDLQFEG